MNSLSSFSFVGETGAPSLMGADSPPKKSLMSLFGEWLLSDNDIDALLDVSLGTNAANDLARECNALPFLVIAAAVGWAFAKEDKNREPSAGRSGVAARGGAAT